MKKKPRILIIASFPPPVHGSAIVSQYIRNSQLLDRSFVFDFVNLSTSRSVEEIGKKSPLKVWRLVCALIQEFCLLATQKYNLCYLAVTCHGLGFIKDAPFALLCKLFHRKIIIHQHNKGMANDLNKWPYRWLFPLVYNNAKVILLSWRLYPDIERIVKRVQVVVCPNGIPDIENIIGHRNNNIPKLLFLSNLMKSKGVLVLLDALKILNEKKVSFVCDILGAGTKEINEYELINEISKRNLQQKVVYQGVKFGEEKSKFLEKADLFLHPSLNDCFPLVLLEAMQYGLPIVTTDEGGILDMVEDGVNGLICEKNDPFSLANCIDSLLKDAVLREKYGRKGREIYEEKFSLPSFESKMKDIFDAKE